MSEIGADGHQIGQILEIFRSLFCMFILKESKHMENCPEKVPDLSHNLLPFWPNFKPNLTSVLVNASFFVVF